jgi:hypothetical protein
MVVGEFHDLETLLKLILELEMKHHSADESDIVTSEVDNASEKFLLSHNIAQEQESNH